MAQRADIEKPTSLVEPANAKSVQSILDRAHRQEISANKALLMGNDGALRVPPGQGLLSETLGLALSHHGRTKKGGPSLRLVAPDTNGRAFHFSHDTVGRNSGGDAGGKGSSTSARKGTSGEGSTGAGTADADARGSSSSSGRAKPDLGSKEAGHQHYIERDEALARDAAEELGLVEGREGASVGAAREGANGMEPGQRARRGNAKEEEKKAEAPGPEAAKATPIERNVAAMQKKIAKAARDRQTQSAEAAQAYIEDPAKVAPQIRHGHSNSFGTIGETFEERVAFWNAVHKHERDKNARTQIRLVLELPHEASPAARQEIVKRFCQEYERLGVPYWAAIHAPTTKNDNRNHHAHVAHANRPARRMVHPTNGQMVWDFTITKEYVTKSRNRKTSHPFRQNTVRAFSDRDYVRDTRKRFAETVNAVLTETECPVRYDPRSYKDMGLDIEPMTHVARIVADKSKIHDFVVMDPEWTRRMIEQEMNAAAVERDKTYMRLKKVERDLAEVSSSVTKLRDTNAKLPKNMKVSPISRMTVMTAKMITKRMLEIERAKIEQRFADEATERTIKHVIEATAPTSGHRDGKARRAKPIDPSLAPDQRAMAILHEAALEEMRLHLIATSGRVRSLGLRASAALHEWRMQAAPAPHDPIPPDEKRRPALFATPSWHTHAPAEPTAQAARHQPRPSPAASPTEREASPQPGQQAAGQAMETPARPLMTGLDFAFASIAPGNERLRQGMEATAARMKASLDAMLSTSKGPDELAEAVKALVAGKTAPEWRAAMAAKAAEQVPQAAAPPPQHLAPNPSPATTGCEYKAATLASVAAQLNPIAPIADDEADVANAMEVEEERRATEAKRSEEKKRSDIEAMNTEGPGERAKTAAAQPPISSGSLTLPVLSDTTSGGQPVGTGFAAEMLASQKFRVVRCDTQSGLTWIVTHKAVWNGTAETADAAAHGLGPAFERIGVTWADQAYPENQDLTIYRLKFSDLAEALGQLHSEAFQELLLRLRRATVRSDAHIQAIKMREKSVVVPPKQAVVAGEPVKVKSVRTPDRGIGS